jgi:hypothetical protein
MAPFPFSPVEFSALRECDSAFRLKWMLLKSLLILHFLLYHSPRSKQINDEKEQRTDIGRTENLV